MSPGPQGARASSGHAQQTQAATWGPLTGSSISQLALGVVRRCDGRRAGGRWREPRRKAGAVCGLCGVTKAATASALPAWPEPRSERKAAGVTGACLRESPSDLRNPAKGAVLAPGQRSNREESPRLPSLCFFVFSHSRAVPTSLPCFMHSQSFGKEIFVV